MLKNITLSAEKDLIQKAREKAFVEKKSVNDLFRGWLKNYVEQGRPKVDLNAFLKQYGHIGSGGKKFTREEMNER